MAGIRNPVTGTSSDLVRRQAPMGVAAARFAPLTVAAWIACYPLLAQTPRVPDLGPAQLARVDSLFAPYDRAAPGYAVGLVQHGRLIYARGFGRANLDYDLPITASSVFNVASLAKQFTAAAIAILIRRGKLSLEDEVRRHLPDFPRYPGPIRIKHLVYMTSGLPEYHVLRRSDGRNWATDYFTNDEAIRAVLQQPRLQFPPGTWWAYSNTNYMLLAQIVERASEMPFAEFTRREIFAPLGMTSSHFNTYLGAVVPNRVTGYNVNPNGSYRQEIRQAPHFGGSGLFTSVEDLARWSRSFETHALGGPELTALLLSTMKFQHDKTNDAFGLVWGNHRGHRTLWYEGGDLGFSSYMVRLPDDGLTVIVLSNLGTGRAAERGRRVLDIILE